MRYTLFAVIVMVGLTACAGVVKKPELVRTSHRLSYNSSFDDLNLVVSSLDKTPVGELVIPKTTDLDSVLLIEPVLVLNSQTEESDARD